MLSDTYLNLKGSFDAWYDDVNDNGLLNGVFDIGLAKIAFLFSGKKNGDTATISVNDSQQISVGASNNSGNIFSGINIDKSTNICYSANNVSNKLSRVKLTPTAATIESEFNGVNEVVTEQDTNGHRIKNSGGIIFEILKNGDIRTNQTVANNPSYNHQTSMLPIYD